ncbi:hypothetical protein HDK77DRAFT_514938 [Phyllosticta capitalensis]
MDASDALQLVRRYSETQSSRKPDDALYKSLADMVQWEERQEANGERGFRDSADKSVQIYTVGGSFGESKYYQVFSGVGDVEEISQELEKSWGRVLKHLGRKKRHLLLVRGDEYEKPSMQRLRRLLDEASRDMEKRRRDTRSGRAKSWVGKVLDALGQYEYLFAMLPREDRYASMFVGAFTASAAQTRESTAERISDCLGRASDQVRTLYKSSKAAPESEYIKRHVACYYCALFKLLAKLLDEWYGSPAHRLRSILGDSLQADIRNAMDTLRYHTEQAEKEASSVTSKRLLDVVALRLGAQCQAGLVGTAMDSPRPKAALESPPGRLQIEPASDFEGQSSQASQDDDKSPKLDEPDAQVYWSAETIQEATQHLSQHLQTEKLGMLSAQSRYLSVNSAIYHALVSWASSGSSGALWIAGPWPDEQPSRNTLTAAFLVGALRGLGVPVAAYFCAYDAGRYGSFDLEEEVVKMVGALVHQVAAILPDVDSESRPEDRVDLSTERLERLDGKESLAEAIQVLGDLLSVGPPLVYIVVDGLQVLDKADDSPNLKGLLRRFIEVLGNAVQESRIVKVGWFTDHQSATLQEAYRAGALRKEAFDFEDEDEVMGMIKVPDVMEFGTP